MFNLKLVNLFLPEITKSSLDYNDVVVANDNDGVGDEISRNGSPHHVARILGLPGSKKCPAMRSLVSMSTPTSDFFQKLTIRT